ncbi:MAG: glycerol-3-phosphate dehydrogenase/oxidase [Clostridiales bacterium]
MNRETMLSRIRIPKEQWDFIVIGGGATGIGIAIDAVTRGYKTLLLEQSDFGKATSSRSTKLIHGGVRYLQQGNLPLVYEALKERKLLLENAPHLVHTIAFAVPGYDWWESPYYGTGLKLYDLMAGQTKTARSKWISRKDLADLIPTIEKEGLKGGVLNYDGQFDDSRLIINMVQTASDYGATLINYMSVKALLKTSKNTLCGVLAHDEETAEQYELYSKAVINATGIFSDLIRQMDHMGAPQIISPSQGIHIVLDKSFLPGKAALLIPNTDDKRVIFAIPWKEHTLIGTTDTLIEEISLEPKPRREEIDFLLTHIGRYLAKKPKIKDILSVFAGIRPLIGSIDKANTASVSRDYKIDISESLLISVAGGKWTTYRKMAEETLERAIAALGLKHLKSVSRNLHIHGYSTKASLSGTLMDYGSDALLLENLIKENAELSKPVYQSSEILKGEVVWAVRNEMARKVEDFLSRRRRTLFLDARLSRLMAPEVARIMASELKVNNSWIDQQIVSFNKLSENYLP